MSVSIVKTFILYFLNHFEWLWFIIGGSSSLCVVLGCLWLAHSGHFCVSNYCF